jgi:predicted small secreted protein
MKTVRNICGILVMMTLVLAACTTGKSQYEIGNYYD